MLKINGKPMILNSTILNFNLLKPNNIIVLQNNKVIVTNNNKIIIVGG